MVGSVSYNLLDGSVTDALTGRQGLDEGLAIIRDLPDLTGRVDVESVLDVVFKEFCIGK